MTQSAALPKKAAPRTTPRATRRVLRLRDGTTVCVRPIRPDDTERLRAFHAGLSPDTIMFRFFHYLPELSAADAEHFTHVDYVRRMALVATTGDGAAERIIGVVRYDQSTEDEGEHGEHQAEVAFVVDDHWQGHGIATALLHRLATYARRRGIAAFVAVTMANNVRMVEVLRHAGFPVTMHYDRGEIEARLDITSPPHARFLTRATPSVRPPRPHVDRDLTSHPAV